MKYKISKCSNNIGEESKNLDNIIFVPRNSKNKL